MSKEYFTENISDEMLAKLIDKTFRFEKNQKINKKPINLFKLIPIVASIVFVIGIVNFMFIIPNFNNEPNTVEPSADINWSVFEKEIDLFVPRIVEKSFFENTILAAVTNQRIYNQITAYYHLQDDFYVLDPNITEREENTILDCYNNIDLTGNDIVRMYKENGIQYDPENPVKIIDPDDPYANVRFGRTRDILLLEIEWHTPETFRELIMSWNGEFWNGEFPEFCEEELNRIKDKTEYRARMVNGKPVNDFEWVYGVNSIYANNDPIDISEYLNIDGYFIFSIYPFVPKVEYIDENGEYQQKMFSHGACSYKYVSSKSEYTQILNDKIIPFCDDLLEKGLITQEKYDQYTIADPLDYYVDLWFN